MNVNRFFILYYLTKKIGPKVLYKMFCNVPVTYINVIIKINTPSNIYKVQVPPDPNHFSANPISPLNCLILALYIIKRNAEGNPMRPNKILSIKKAVGSHTQIVLTPTALFKFIINYFLALPDSLGFAGLQRSSLTMSNICACSVVILT